MIGRTLLHYQITEKLGEGGMGVVYKARDTRLNRHVVLKVLRAESIGDVDRNRRFFQEAQAASALNHPNIITIHDMAAEAGVAFIVMEFIPGNALDTLIPPTGMTIEQALNYALQISGALSVAHEAGVIHRDLKPGNIMVTPSGLIKLLDFGLAKLTTAWRAGDSSGIPVPATVEGSIVGTVSYMSPEQALGRMLDARSDLFSFGSVLYEMLTARRVFGNASPVVSLTSVLRDNPPRPSTINPLIPPALDDIIMRCLEKDPANRFQTAAELNTALARVRAALAAPSIVKPSPKPEPAIFSEGREALRQWTAGSLAHAKECFEQALRTNRDHCPVYACMSEYYASAALLGLRDPADAMPKAEWAARKALEIDSACEQATVTLSIVRGCFQFDWQSARALSASVQLPESRTRYAMWLLRPLGLFDEAEAILAGNELALAWLDLERGAVEEAAQHAGRSGQHWIAAWVFAWALQERGQFKQAIEMCEGGLAIEPGQPLLESTLAAALVRSGQVEAARARLHRPAKWWPKWLPIPAYAAMGDGDAGFAAARDSVQNHDAGVITALRMPGCAVVRLGSRFAELVREMNLDRPAAANRS